MRLITGALHQYYGMWSPSWPEVKSGGEERRRWKRFSVLKKIKLIIWIASVKERFNWQGKEGAGGLQGIWLRMLGSRRTPSRGERGGTNHIHLHNHSYLCSVSIPVAGGKLVAWKLVPQAQIAHDCSGQTLRTVLLDSPILHSCLPYLLN